MSFKVVHYHLVRTFFRDFIIFSVDLVRIASWKISVCYFSGNSVDYESHRAYAHGHYCDLRWITDSLHCGLIAHLMELQFHFASTLSETTRIALAITDLLYIDYLSNKHSYIYIYIVFAFHLA